MLHVEISLGSVVRMLQLQKSSTPMFAFLRGLFNKIVIDSRNIKWMKGGKIQEHCTAASHCLIYVGLSHLVLDKNPLLKLLSEEGFVVKKIKASEIPEEFFSTKTVAVSDLN